MCSEHHHPSRTTVAYKDNLHTVEVLALALATSHTLAFTMPVTFVLMFLAFDPVLDRGNDLRKVFMNHRWFLTVGRASVETLSLTAKFELMFSFSTDQPKAALDLVQRWLANTPLA